MTSLHILNLQMSTSALAVNNKVDETWNERKI